MSIADHLNADLAAHAPALHACLSGLGRRAYFPQGIPAQSAEARGTRYNATIGQVTDGRGSPLPLPVLADAMANLDPRMSHLYSPPSGHKALRQAWAARQREQSGGSTAKTSLPFVTLGLSQALGFAAELFLDEGVPVLVPSPRWGQLRPDVRGSTRRAPRSLRPLRRDRPDHRRAETRSRRPPGARHAGAQLPSQPVWHVPHRRAGRGDRRVRPRPRRPACRPGRRCLRRHDVGRGSAGTLAVLGPRRGARPGSPRHPPVRRRDQRAAVLSGPRRLPHGGARSRQPRRCRSREQAGRTGALLQWLSSRPSQAAVLRALEAEDLPAQIAASHETLRARHQRLKAALSRHESEGLRPYPFNSGVFAIVGLADGVDAEQTRRELIDEQSVGVIRVGALNALRLAYCSVAEEDIDGLVERLAAKLG